MRNFFTGKVIALILILTALVVSVGYVAAPEWNLAGVKAILAAKGGPKQLPTISNFYASPTQIEQGQGAKLYWSVSNATTITIDPGVGQVTVSPVNVAPTTTTTYILTAKNANGSKQASTQITVTIPQPPTSVQYSEFFFFPNHIKAGESATLYWYIKDGAQNPQIDKLGTVTHIDSKVISPSATETYTLTFRPLGQATYETLKATIVVYDPNPQTSEHPRIIAAGSKLNEMKTKFSSNHPDWLALKAKADEYLSMPVLGYDQGTLANTINQGYRGSGYPDPMRTLALAYLVSGNTSYGNKAIELADKLDAAGTCPFMSSTREKFQFAKLGCTAGYGDASNGYPLRFYGEVMAIGYDWLYNLLPVAKRVSYANQIAEYINYAKDGKRVYEIDGPSVSNFYAGYFGVLGLGGLAVENDHPQGVYFVNEARNQFDTVVKTGFESGGAQYRGDEVEGWAYGSSVVRYMKYILAYKTAKGIDLESSSNIAKQTIKTMIYGLKPSRWQIMDHGEWGGSISGIFPSYVAGVAAFVLDGKSDGPYAQFLNSYIVPAPSNAKDYEPSVSDKMLYYNSARASTDFRSSFPLSYRTEQGSEYVYSRGNWQDDAVWSSFRIGGKIHTIGHQVRDAGGVFVARGADPLVVHSIGHRLSYIPNTTQYDSRGYYGSAPQGIYITASEGENTLFFDDLGQYLPTSSQYKGGQGYNGVDNILAYEANNDYAYGRADYTRVYDKKISVPTSTTLKSFVRSYVFLRPNVILVADHVRSTDANHVKKIRFFFPQKPVVSGNSVTVENGNSKAYLRALAPSSLTIANLTLPHASPSQVGAFYTDTSATAPAMEQNFLHAIVAKDKVSVAPEIQNVPVSQGGMLGVFVSDGANKVVALLRADENASAPTLVSYSANTGSVTVHYLFGVESGADYNIKVNGADQEIATASSQGVLKFSAPSGTVEIQKI